MNSELWLCSSAATHSPTSKTRATSITMSASACATRRFRNALRRCSRPRMGNFRLALDYAAEAALMDLQNLDHNARDGLPIAPLAGTWIALVNGFGGMRDHAGVLSFAPRLPDGLTSLSFSIVRRKVCLRVEVTARAATYRLTQGRGTLQIIHHGEPLMLNDSNPIELPIPASLSRERPVQPPGREPRRRSPGGLPR